MDKKNKKKTVIKRKSDEAGDSEKKQKIMVNRKAEEKEKVEVVNQVVEVPVEQGQQIVHTGQLVEGNFEQPVFVNMKGEPVQLGPNTVILYEQSGNPSNFAFGGMWTMDSSGRIVMAETIYDVKGEPEEESGNFVQNNTEVPAQQVEEQQNTYQQFELSSGSQVDGTQEYEVAIIENPPAETTESRPQQEGQHEYEVAIIENPPAETTDNPDPQVVTTEEQLIATGTGAVRWLNQKYDFVVRKLQLNYDAGVKLLHSQSGCIQCVYLTTPSMQLAFNAVPQFLCIETGIEFNSTIPTVGGTGTPAVKHNVTLFLAEDGNGKSVIVSAGISTLIGEDLTWLLETFKSCNPAWRQVRCVVCDPTKSQQAVRAAFPSAHVSCSVWQAAAAAGRAVAAALRRDEAAPALHDVPARAKTYALALLRGDHTPAQLQALKRNIIGTGAGTLRLWEIISRPNGAIQKLDSWLEADNYTNILHKGLERLVTKFQQLVRHQLQPDDFVSVFFNVANQLENERRTFALSRLRDTETLKQSPTDTITQYAYNLMSHQTKLAQKCLDDRAGRKHSSAAICKYGTSTQECSCLFSKVFRLPCRHILMLTTELKVKTHIPFEPRWTVQHCLFGCDSPQTTTTTNNTGGSFMEQVVVESDEQHRQAIQQPQQIHQVGGVRQQQYVLTTPGQPATPVSQVIFCGGAGPGSPVLTSVLPPAAAVLAPHHALH
ncbi:uncharacterized protein LOC113492258 isoform X1 [Trichoplusia ni]|uniref:Uncharacterized protein LOC113492257 isoform X1 n=1 Tax=Trichoplusia ni TaxID=7111 RepID=A0A7E5VB23_TRINI|nr:uncharacterized protein LOC113492257 isoform X1 [Trichoplusia ni]XP_026725482.1 uncharacterized protein LOC113492258 isoform X1 [Trichoplusia ni]